MRTHLGRCLRCGSALALHENDWAAPSLWSWRCPACFLSGREFLTADEAIADATFQPGAWTLWKACQWALGLGILLAGAGFALLMLTTKAPTEKASHPIERRP